MRRIFTHERVDRFLQYRHSLSNKQLGLQILILSILTVGGMLLVINYPVTTLLFWVGTLMLMFNSPIDSLINYCKLFGFFSKVAKFGLLKPGQLAEFDPISETRLYPRGARLVLAEEFQKMPDEDLKFRWGSSNIPYPLCGYDIPREVCIYVSTSSDLVLVLETEKLWTRQPIIKVLYNEKVYYVNPKKLRRVQ